MKKDAIEHDTALFQALMESCRAIDPKVRTGIMFGCPGVFHGRRMAACVYGEAIASVMRAWVPLCWEAFEDFRLGAVTLSAPALKVVQRMLRGEPVVQADSGLSKREWEELMEALGQNR